MAVHSLKPATDRRLGRPLPCQQANQTRVHPVPPEFLPLHHAVLWSYAVLAVISDCYPPVQGLSLIHIFIDLLKNFDYEEPLKVLYQKMQNVIRKRHLNISDKELQEFLVLIAIFIKRHSYINDQEDILKPVSYTHLDVYKRQGKCII